MSGLCRYYPPIGPEHPDYIHPRHLFECRDSTTRSEGGEWVCTAERFHLTEHAAHARTYRGAPMLARWPQEPAAPEHPDTPDFTEALEKAVAEADGMMTLASIDACRTLAITALDQAEITREPHWFVAAEHHVRALHALALVGRGVGVEDGGEG